MSRPLTITSVSGRLVVTLPPVAVLRRASGDCPAVLDPARALACSRAHLRAWAARARAELPAWLGEHRPDEVAQTQEFLP